MTLKGTASRYHHNRIFDNKVGDITTFVLIMVGEYRAVNGIPRFIFFMKEGGDSRVPLHGITTIIFLLKLRATPLKGITPVIFLLK